MATCDTCGNDYAKTFDIEFDDKTYTFDSFECAIEALAPRCARCNTRIIGHGIEDDEDYYCCANCAREAGVSGARDNV